MTSLRRRVDGVHVAQWRALLVAVLAFLALIVLALVPVLSGSQAASVVALIAALSVVAHWALAYARVHERRAFALHTSPSEEDEDQIAELGTLVKHLTETLLVARRRLGEAESERATVLEMLRHVDRLRTVGEMATSIAHELATPLHVVSGRARLIEQDEHVPDEARKSAAVCRAQTRRMSTLIRQMLDFARRATHAPAPLRIDAIANETKEMLDPLLRKWGITLEVTSSADAPTVHGDAAQMVQLLTNLVINAAQASRRGDRVEVAIREEAEGELRFVAIDVTDSGTGIARDELPHLFEPFYTTKASGHGTGLGLTVAQNIARAHGGRILVQSTPGKGSVFSVRLASS